MKRMYTDNVRIYGESAKRAIYVDENGRHFVKWYGEYVEVEFSNLGGFWFNK